MIIDIIPDFLQGLDCSEVEKLPLKSYRESFILPSNHRP